MRIAQIVLAAASEFEKKCQRVDFAALSASHEVIVGSTEGAEIAHVYGNGDVRDLKIPFVASRQPVTRKFSLRRPQQPAAIVGFEDVPEAVEETYFASRQQAVAIQGGGEPPHSVVGSFGRASTRNIVEQTVARIHRFRDDITWNVFERVPTPDDLAGVDAWIDPAIDEDDLDGFAAEALVAGTIVVASHTNANSQRLEKGRTGLLVPRNDPNELTHAILAALFKPELRQMKIAAARQTASKFRPRQRLKALTQLYESIR